MVLTPRRSSFQAYQPYPKCSEIFSLTSSGEKRRNNEVEKLWHPGDTDQNFDINFGVHVLKG